MSENVVYSEVVFVKKNQNDKDDPDQSSSAKQASRPCCDGVRLLLMAMCFFMTAGLIALSLQYVYTDKMLKDLEEQYNDLNQNLSALSPVLQEMHKQQENLSRALNNSACPKDWEYHAGKCYLFSTNTLNWAASQDSCVSDGGHLVIINNQDEQEFLMSIIKNKDTQSEFWIGLTDGKQERQWLWVDNTELKKIRFWSEREPDDWKGSKGEFPKGEDCAQIKDTQDLKSWFDAFCDHTYRRICETRSSRQI